MCEHIIEIGANNLRGELSVLPEEYTAYLFMFSRITYFLFFCPQRVGTFLKGQMCFWPASLSACGHSEVTVLLFILSLHVFSTGAVISVKQLYTTCVKDKRS